MQQPHDEPSGSEPLVKRRRWRPCQAAVVVAVLLATLIAFPVSAPAVQKKAEAKKTGAKKTGKTEKVKPAGKKPVARKGKEEPPKGPQANLEAARKLIEQVIRRGLVPPAVAAPAAVPAAAANPKPVGNADPEARDPVDLLAPQDPRQAKLLRQARALLKEGRGEQALEYLAVLLNPPPEAGFDADSLVRRSEGGWVSVLDEANRLLGTLSPELLDRYRTRHDAEATRRLGEALRSGRESALVDVADRFFHTAAGRKAANRLGSLQLDRGRDGLAARRFAALLAVSDPVTTRPAWRLKAAMAFHRAGLPGPAGRLLAGLPASGVRLPGARTVDPAKWFGQLPATAETDRVLDDWPVFFGTARRTGRVRGGTPLLLPQWTRRLTDHHGIRRLIRELVEDMRDAGLTTVPAFVPLVVGDKAVYRTLRGVAVVDIKTGRVLWETEPGVSVEQFMTGMMGRGNRSVRPFAIGMAPMRINANFLPGAGVPSSSHPLAGVLFAAGLHGILASDGRRLFVVEDRLLMVPGGQRGRTVFFPGMGRQPIRGLWNRLVAWDLENGHSLWEVGGAAMNESFDLPLAGTRFLGAPVPDEGELLVVGERDNELRLHGLDAATGQPTWSQRIAYVDQSILQSPNRHRAAIQVAAGDGVVVCPTGVGWLVAVERASRRILWAHRYTRPSAGTNKRPPGGFGMGVVVRSPMTPGDSWQDAPPVISGQKVVFTPAEAKVIVCLDLFDGRKLWEKPKGKSLHLAGVFDEIVVLVGTDAVTALAVADGRLRWRRALPAGTGPPCGRGVATPDALHLPLASGEVWTIALADGVVRTRAVLPSNHFLGNLAMSKGTLLSLGPGGLTGFVERTSLEARIVKALAADPRDPWALVQRAEIHLLHRRFDQAVRDLKTLDAGRLESSDRPRWQAALRQGLVALVRNDLAGHEAELAELAVMAVTSEQRLVAERLAADLAVATGRFDLAVRQLDSLAERDGDRLIDRADGPRVRVRLNRWVAGRLEMLWSKLPAAARTPIDAWLTERAATVAAGGQLDAMRRFTERFGFHPASRVVERRLIETLVVRDEFARAETRLLRLAESSEAATAAEAGLRLASLWVDRGLVGDARELLGQLAGTDEAVKTPDGTAVARRAAQLRAGLPAEVAGKPVSWGDKLSIVTGGGSGRSVTRQDVRLGARPLPWFRTHRCVFDNSSKRLFLEAVDSGRLAWSVPLRQAPGGNSRRGLAARAVGHRLVITGGGVVQAICPVTRRVAWSHVIGGGSGRSVPTGRRSMQAMSTGGSFVGQSILSRRQAATGPLAVVNAEYVCVYGRRRATVIDTATGQVRWSLDRLPRGTSILGSERVVYVVSANANPQALSAVDGRPLSTPKLKRLLAGAAWLGGQDVVWFQNAGTSGVPGLKLLGLNWTQTVIRREDVVTGKVRWQQSLPGVVKLSLLEPGTLAVLRADGTFELLDLASGHRRTIGELNPDDMKDRTTTYAFADFSTVYLVLNRRFQGSYYSINLSSVRVHGLICAFDRATGQERWRKELEQQNLVLDKLDHAPVVMLASRTYKRQDNLRYYILKLVAFDKHTGRQLANLETSSNYWSFRGLRLNLAERFIEFTAYNRRIRLISSQ